MSIGLEIGKSEFLYNDLVSCQWVTTDGEVCYNCTSNASSSHATKIRCKTSSKLKPFAWGKVKITFLYTCRQVHTRADSTDGATATPPVHDRSRCSGLCTLSSENKKIECDHTSVDLQAAKVCCVHFNAVSEF